MSRPTVRSLAKLRKEGYVAEVVAPSYIRSRNKGREAKYLIEICEGIAVIPLTKGAFCRISTEDVERIAAYKWVCAERRNTSYAAASIGGSPVLMHRFILKAPKGFQVDHIDGDGLNNARENIRLCTRQENSFNTKMNKNESGYKGVHKHPRSERWTARLMHNGKNLYLGIFKSPEEAAMVYDSTAKRIFGEYARLNFE